jgi:hypothetical protein
LNEIVAFPQNSTYPPKIENPAPLTPRNGVQNLRAIPNL